MVTPNGIRIDGRMINNKETKISIVKSVWASLSEWHTVNEVAGIIKKSIPTARKYTLFLNTEKLLISERIIGTKTYRYKRIEGGEERALFLLDGGALAEKKVKIKLDKEEIIV